MGEICASGSVGGEGGNVLAYPALPTWVLMPNSAELRWIMRLVSAVIAASRLSASKNQNCPIVATRESCCHNQTRTNPPRSLCFEVPCNSAATHFRIKRRRFAARSSVELMAQL
jgi:hypothetical protein